MRECFAFCKKKKESPWAGERLQANKGIFCVSRIFGVTHTYVRTNKTVSPKNPRVTHSVCSDFWDNSFRKVCRIFRAFRRKVSTMSKRNIRGGYQQMFHKVHGIPAPATTQSIKSSVKTEQTSRKCECFTSIFVEMTAVTSFLTTQNSLMLLSEFSGNDRTCFFFFLSPTSFFFFRKKRKEIGIKNKNINKISVLEKWKI